MLALIRKVNPVWAMLGLTLGANYFLAHKLKWFNTLCTSSRRVMPNRVFVAAWLALTAWIIPHRCQWKIAQILRRALT